MKNIPMNIEAMRKYNEAQLLGNAKRDDAIQKVREGISCFESLEAALSDAEENIKRYTKSDFSNAHFYELVRNEVLRKMYGKLYGVCETCKWWSDMGKCSNKSNNQKEKEIFENASPSYSCVFYYPKSPNKD